MVSFEDDVFRMHSSTGFCVDSTITVGQRESTLSNPR